MNENNNNLNNYTHKEDIVTDDSKKAEARLNDVKNNMDFPAISKEKLYRDIKNEEIHPSIPGVFEPVKLTPFDSYYTSLTSCPVNQRGRDVLRQGKEILDMGYKAYRDLHANTDSSSSNITQNAPALPQSSSTVGNVNTELPVPVTGPEPQAEQVNSAHVPAPTLDSNRADNDLIPPMRPASPWSVSEVSDISGVPSESSTNDLPQNTSNYHPQDSSNVYPDYTDMPDLYESGE